MWNSFLQWQLRYVWNALSTTLGGSSRTGLINLAVYGSLSVRSHESRRNHLMVVVKTLMMAHYDPDAKWKLTPYIGFSRRWSPIIMNTVVLVMARALVNALRLGRRTWRLCEKWAFPLIVSLAIIVGNDSRKKRKWWRECRTLPLNGSPTNLEF